MCIPRKISHNFPTWLLRFRTLWYTFTRFNPLFWPFTWFRSIVVDPCFSHRHKSTQKLFQMNAFLVDCEQSQHPICTELSYAQMCVQSIDQTLSSGGYDLSYFTNFHFRAILNSIMEFIDHFWRSDLIWAIWAWYDFCANTTATKFGKPLLNYSIR